MNMIYILVEYIYILFEIQWLCSLGFSQFNPLKLNVLSH